MILAGDIGGTKTVLAHFEPDGGTLRAVREERFSSRDHPTFTEIVHAFLKRGPRPRVACFGAAGPVMKGRIKTTNLPWLLDEKELAGAMGAERVKLLNDLEATAYGMLHLPESDLAVLNPGTPGQQGNVAVIAAGTGLGEAMLWFDGERHHPIASEGGHVDFAPRDEREIDLLRYLKKKYQGRVSCERILSGPGFHGLYEFLRDRGEHPESPELARRLASEDPSAAIGELGLAGADPLCVATLDLFCSLYGAEAGNLALKCLALGGTFVGGGIAPKLLPALRKGDFMKSFLDKGRFSNLLASTRVAVSLNPRTALLGAANFALRMC